MRLKTVIDDNDYTSHRLFTCGEVVTAGWDKILCNLMFEYCKID